MPNWYDVFLSHNSSDKPAVRELAAALRARGLTVFLDEDTLLPGDRWQKVLEEAIETSGVGAVLVGKDGLGPWENIEMQALLVQAVEHRIPVIPVLLPGAPQKPQLPAFLKQFTWSDLRSGMKPTALDRLVAGIRQQRSEEPRPDPLVRYRAWAAERYDGLSLIGLGGGDLGKLRFDEVYVPLRIVQRPRDVVEVAGFAGERLVVELGIKDLFTTPHAASPHALLLGDPGAGKTTGLLKLLHLCLAPGGLKALHLDPETLPVFLRLRRFTADDLYRPFADFLKRELERELGDVAGEVLPVDLGSRLWEHGRLLLLLDGLDELADEALRVEVCKVLEELAPASASGEGLRIVISCRFSGYSDQVRFGDHFSSLEVRPLNAAQCRSLVRHWFRAAQRALPGRLSPPEAHKATQSLLVTLDEFGYGSQRWKVLVGSPLLLTLLCVISYRSGQTPRHRAAFYDQCLRVLLGPWSHGRQASIGPTAAPPLDVETALAVLRSVAWALHRRQTRDDLSVAEFALLLEDCLAPRSRQVPAPQVLEWLHREAGVLTAYGEHRYGFLHLGLQEYLAAAHVASQGEALLTELCTHAREEWWQEVFLLLSGLPGHAAFAPLLTRLLTSRALLDQADLIRACLEEAAAPELGPFLAVLSPGESPERQATVLRLLRGSKDPRLEAPVRALLGSHSADVQALSRQIIENFARLPEGAAGEAGVIFVLHHPSDRKDAIALAQALRVRGWKAAAAAEDAAWRKDPERLVRDAQGVVVPVGAGGSAPWEEQELLSCLQLFARRHCMFVLAQLPASGDWPELPEFLSRVSRVDLRDGLTTIALSALDHALAGVPVIERSFVPGEPIVEPQTGIRFVWVPGGSFEMGDADSPYAQPAHWVRISSFWLGETLVTNAQYTIFLEQTGADEPEYWRDRRFASSEQPVVGVSWMEAQAFCRWLGETWGRTVQLPSEAQWEFAARGPEGRAYPWGSEPPDATRACFGLDWKTGQPASVGSTPAGRGPFGTLDQAGNVWEWCYDAWDEKAYDKRAAARHEVADPIIEGAKDSARILRGGGWYDAEDLRAASRTRYPARNRVDDVGFRVAAAPASLGS